MRELGLARHAVVGCFAGLPEAILVRRALAGFATLERIEDRRLIVPRCRARRPALLVLPSIDRRGASTATIVQRCALEAAHVHVIVVVTAAWGSALSVARAARSGALAVSIRSWEELRGVLRPLFDEARAGTSECDALEACLFDIEPADLRALLLMAAQTAHARLTVDELAQGAGASVRGLTRRLAAAGWPPPARLIRWGKLLRASVALTRHQPASLGAAATSGFGSTRLLDRARATLLGDSAGTGVLTPAVVVRALDVYCRHAAERVPPPSAKEVNDGASRRLALLACSAPPVARSNDRR